MMLLLAVSKTALWTAGIVLVLALTPLWGKLGIVIHHMAHREDTWRERVQRRFRGVTTMAWVFAWCKMRMDAMFIELPDLLKEHEQSLPAGQKIEKILDIGCGYGITGCALLEWLPGVKVYGIDPSSSRAKVANIAFADRGSAWQSGAPDFINPQLPDKVDAVFMLDVIHFLNAQQLDATLKNIQKCLAAGGRLYIRAILLHDGPKSWLWHMDTRRRKWLGIPTHHQLEDKLKATLADAGFQVIHTSHSGDNPELGWFIAKTA